MTGNCGGVVVTLTRKKTRSAIHSIMNIEQFAAWLWIVSETLKPSVHHPVAGKAMRHSPCHFKVQNPATPAYVYWSVNHQPDFWASPGLVGTDGSSPMVCRGLAKVENIVLMKLLVGGSCRMWIWMKISIIIWKILLNLTHTPPPSILKINTLWS